MAEINIETTVTAPDKINITLVRADHAYTTNIFRTFFEIFLVVTGVLVGHLLSLKVVENIYWLFLVTLGLSDAAFLLLSYSFRKKSEKF